MVVPLPIGEPDDVRRLQWIAAETLGGRRGVERREERYSATVSSSGRSFDSLLASGS
jgi:hypothetical protein